MKMMLKAFVAALVFCLVPCTWSAAQDTGVDLYKSKCVTCHGPDGKGETMMGKKFGIKDLASAEVQGKSDSDLKGVISGGKDKMPAYKDKLSSDQIDSLVKYIRTLKK